MSQSPRAARPNVLFLMSDEHRADVTGYEGDAVIRTPVLDRLAASGVVFRNAYTPSPICIPARQSLMAGQLPMTTGCLRFGEDLPPGHMTFARRFAQHAYATVACGKLHHTGPDQMQGWTQRVCGDIGVGAQHLEGRDEASFAALTRPTSTVKWSDAKEIQRAGIGRGGPVVRDEYTVLGATQFIQEYFASPHYDREQRGRPLLLKVSLLQPHYPYATDEAKFVYYLNRVAPYLDQPVSAHPFLGRRQVRPGADVTERELRRATAAYYGMVETIDTHFGTVLDALSQVGEDLDDWIVVYTTDHGEMLGEHGIWEKQKFYEGSVRVPLVIRWPRRFAHRVVEENVNLCDLFATLCELAGIPTPEGLDSRSLIPLMAGDAAHRRHWREEWHDETVSHFSPPGQHNLMIKRGSLKYQYYGAAMPEVLFDLETDPSETTDVLDDPAYAARLRAFRERRDALGYRPRVESARSAAR